MTQPVLDPIISYKAINKPDSAARRTRLRQFQAQLTERVQAAKTGSDLRVRQLGVMIGGERCLLDLQQVSEVLSVGALTKVPLTHDWYMGLSSVRGNLIGVIDVARFQGGTPALIGPENRIIVFAQGLSFNCGLLVSRVLGLRNIAEMEPQTIEGVSEMPWLAKRYLDQDNQTWTYMDLSLIIQDPRFLHVGI